LYDRNGLREQVATAVAAHAGGIEHRAVSSVGSSAVTASRVFRLALALEVAHHLLDLFVRHERAVHAADASAAGHIEHVALAEQLFGAHLAQNGAAVDFEVT